MFFGEANSWLKQRIVVISADERRVKSETRLQLGHPEGFGVMGINGR
jgi:hypothetical protein